MAVEIKYSTIESITVGCDVCPESGDGLKLTPEYGLEAQTADVFFMEVCEDDKRAVIGVTREHLRDFAKAVLVMLGGK